jgi:hypothetical protein
MTDGQIGVIGTLAGVVVGALLTEATAWIARGRRARGLYVTIRAELEECADKATTYIDDRIAIPLYRLPTDAYRYAAETLIADGTIDAAEVKPLRRFYATVDELNRGLDYISDTPMDNALLGDNMKRNILKARRLTREGEHYKAANAALTKRSV